MGVFDYLSSLWDAKDRPAETVKPNSPADAAPTRTSPPAAKKGPDASTRQGKGRPDQVRASREARSARPAHSAPAHAPAPPRAAAAAPPQAVATPSARESEAAEVDRSLDAVFGEGASKNVTHVSAIAKELDEAAVRELFGGIAANHARPIKNFIFELKRGSATKEWIEVCRPVMATLLEGAESMELRGAAKAMTEFNEALGLAQSDGDGAAIDDTARDLLLAAYHEMAEALPEAFQAGDDERRRETMIIHSLLKQVPDVGHVTFERLYGAGLTSLEALFVANREDLAATTGIPGWLCDRIVERIQVHRKELERTQRASGQGERRERLRKLVADLRAKHEGFERAAAEEWADPSRAETKRECRQGRQMCALQIEVVLAEMGEVDLVEQIQKLPFGRRIERLVEYIDHSAEPVAAGVLAGVGEAPPAGRPAER